MSQRSSSTSVSRAQLMALAAAFFGWMFDGFEMGIFPLIARPALQQMGQRTGEGGDAFVGHWMGIITALFLVGAALGGGLFGWLGDRIGRIRALSLSVLTYSLFSGLVYFATEPWHLGAARFVAALGMGGEWSLGVALVMEVWPDERRPLLAGLIGVSCNGGLALIATVGLFFSVTRESWRWVAIVGTGPAVLTVLLRYFVPESERWKAAAAAGPHVRFGEIFGGAVRSRTVVACLLSSVVLVGTWASIQWLPLWADQLTGGLRPSAKAYAQVCSSVGAVVGSLAGAWLAVATNRRWSFFILSAASLASCSALFRGVGEYGTAFLSLAFAAGFFSGSFYGWLPLYLPELFPTRLRATGQGLSFNAGRLLAAAASLEMGRLLTDFSGSYARAGAVTSLVYAVGLVVIWFAPETQRSGLTD